MKDKQQEGRPKARRKKAKNAMVNKQIILVAYIFAGLFLALMVYIGKFIAFDSQDVITNSYNKRQDTFAKKVIRGNILSSDGKVLAESKVNEKGEVTRSYPYGNMYAHVVGFASRGKSGIESIANYNLLTSNANIFERIYNDLTEEKNIGDNIVTTLDSRLQKVAYDALGSRKGAVVVLEPDTGKILAMVSKPDFNPNEIDSIWDSITKEDASGNSTLLNRATQGLYPPGSTFKTLTTLQYIKEHKNLSHFSYECSGKTTVNGVVINCYNNSVHGKLDLQKALAKSCNGAFAKEGAKLNQNSFYRLASDFLFNQELPYQGAYKKSSYVLNNKSDKGEIPQTMIGQGKTQITPLHNALIFSTIANGGVMMKPYLVDRIENYNGDLVKKYSPKVAKKVISTQEAQVMTGLLKGVVDEGTASSLKGLNMNIAGKTGSAEFETGKAAHAWFVGFAPSDNPKVVVAVVVENVGTGSTYAVPIAKQIFAAYQKIEKE